MAVIVVATALLSVLLVLFGLNFAVAEKRLQRRVRHRYGTADPQFLRSMNVLLGPTAVSGNTIEPLLNGVEVFPAMLEAIAAAEHTITFETFIFHADEAIGRRFSAALLERATAGVKIHVLLDWVGAVRVDRKLLQRLRRGGIEVRKYHAPSLRHISRMNNRTHRKLLVIDGRVAFTGGIGIADAWDGDAADGEHWRDTHFRVRGPVVAQMQAVFVDNWIKVSGEVLHGTSYFPASERHGKARAQMFSSSPSGGAESMQLMYLMMLAAATRSIRLSAAYFVPDRLAARTLVDAVLRGVRVQVVLPGRHSDNHLARRASQARWSVLMRAGIEIHEYQPSRYHCKALIIDERVVSIGSTNFDPRSFRLNDEANLNVYDRAFAARMTAQFERDLALSRRVARARWSARSLYHRFEERVAGLLQSQL